MYTMCCHDSCLMNEQSNMLTEYSFLIIFFIPRYLLLSISRRVIGIYENVSLASPHSFVGFQLLLAFLLLLVSLLLFRPCCCRRLPKHMLDDGSDVVGIPAVANFRAVTYIFFVSIPAVLLASLL